MSVARRPRWNEEVAGAIPATHDHFQSVTSERARAAYPSLDTH